MKRIMTEPLAFGLLCLGLCMPAAAEEQFYYYTNSGGGITVMQYIGPSGNVTVPSAINGLPVTEIGSLAFNGMSGITGVTIPDSVTNVSDSAFNQCHDLSEVTFGTNVLYIRSWAFYSCPKLTAVTIPDSVASIADMAFASCGLTNVNMGLGLTNLGGGAFQGCHYLQSFVVPDGVGSIGATAFFQCFDLTNVILGAGTTNIGNGAFYSCSLKTVFARDSAPTLGSGVFSSGEHPYVYYLTGRTNWDAFSSATGFTNILWNPTIQTGDGSFGITNLSDVVSFGFNITGTSNLVIVVEACDDLTSLMWVPVGTNTLTDGTSYFSDSQYASYPNRFYRIHSPFGSLASLFPPQSITFQQSDGMDGSGQSGIPGFSSEFSQSREGFQQEAMEDDSGEDFIDPDLFPPGWDEIDFE